MIDKLFRNFWFELFFLVELLDQTIEPQFSKASIIMKNHSRSKWRINISFNLSEKFRDYKSRNRNAR